jgi:hypothetical protein
MCITEMITLLQRYLQEYGNVQVIIYNSSGVEADITGADMATFCGENVLILDDRAIGI